MAKTVFVGPLSVWPEMATPSQLETMVLRMPDEQWKRLAAWMAADVPCRHCGEPVFYSDDLGAHLHRGRQDSADHGCFCEEWWTASDVDELERRFMADPEVESG